MPKADGRKLRILLISDFAYPLRAGTERLVFGIASWISEKYGHQVDILTPNWDNLPSRERAGKVTIYRFKTHGKERSRPLKRLKDYVSAGMDLPKYDIYEGFYTLAPLMATVALAKLKRSKSILTIFTRSQLEDNFRNPLKKHAILALLRQADRLTTTFWSVRDYLARKYFDPGKISCIQGWLDPGFKPKRAAAARKGKNILFVGRLVAPKGIFVLLEAFSGLQMPDVSLNLIGPKDEEQKVKSEIRRLGLEGKVHLLGTVSESKLIDWYNRSDLVVAPTLGKDALTWTVMEAMACAKPVVYTEKFELPMDAGQFGIVVQKGSVLELRRAMQKLLLDPKYAASLGRNGRFVALAMFEKGKVMEKYARLYRGLAD